MSRPCVCDRCTIGGPRKDGECSRCWLWHNSPKSRAHWLGITEEEADAQMREEQRAASTHELTVGMATYDDATRLIDTVQQIRLGQDTVGVEFLVIDNFGCPRTRDFCAKAGVRYVLSKETVGTAAPRDRVFREAKGEAVLCIDSHVFLAPGVLAGLKAYFRDHPDSKDLLSGPLLYDDLKSQDNYFAPQWRARMYGTWAKDERGTDPAGEPFEIPMMGLGMFAMRRTAWPGFNPRFRGFGGEEGYLHQKVRNRGGRCLCVPAWRWWHHFNDQANPQSYPNRLDDRLFNYLVGWQEVGLPVGDVVRHFAERLPEAFIVRAGREALGVNLDVAAIRAGAEVEQPKVAPAVAQRMAQALACVYRGEPTGETKECQGCGGGLKPVHRCELHGECLVDAQWPGMACCKLCKDRQPLPFVSCLMPTFNRCPDRLELLAEAVECFLRQDYPADRRELVILNDTPGQLLIPPCGTFDGQDCRLGEHNIRVYNRPERFGSLGEKRNELVRLAAPGATLLCPWDDDDLSLPHRISQAVRMLGAADYWQPPQQIYWPVAEGRFYFEHAVGVRHACSIFRRSAWEAVGGYPATNDEDARFDAALKRSCKVAPEGPLPPEEWAYVLRWGVSPCHLSGVGADDAHAGNYRQIGERPITPGEYRIVPGWKQDYVALTRQTLSRLAV